MKSKYTLEYITKMIDSFRNGEFELICIEKFDGCKSKVSVKHKKCGRILVNQNIANFIGLNRGCKFCDSNKLDSIKIKSLIENNIEYKCVCEPVDLKTKVKIKHITCGNTFEMRPADFIYNGHRCSKCLGKNTYNSDTLKKIVKNIDSNYEFVSLSYNSKVKPSRQKMTVRHLECGNTTECIIHNFVNNGQRCKECSKSKLKYISNSKGSQFIEDFLNKNNISYEREKRFDGLKYKRHLRFDFFILWNNEEILIEFDGKQHFETNKNNKIFTNELVKKTQERDKLKNEFCLKNNKKLIRFSYKQTLEEINNELNLIFRKSDSEVANQS